MPTERVKLRVDYRLDTASREEIETHLQACSDQFVPPLQSRVQVEGYARKIRENAVTFEAWHEHRLVGLLAAYLNDAARKRGFITNVSVVRDWARRGIASELVDRCVAHSKELGFEELRLEVDASNLPAVRLYESKGFKIMESRGDTLEMRRTL